MSGKIIFNADDFGISLGVNEAIYKAYQEGILNAASLMVNQKYASDAVALSKKMPLLDLGLHLNLTNEYAAAEAQKIPLLADQNGKFKNGFLKLLLLSFFKPHAFKKQVQIEIEAQIKKALKMGARIEHIDSHRHVHIIPSIFDVVRQLAPKYKIKRIRTINECALLTIKANKSFSYFFDGGMVKYFLLRFLSAINMYQSSTYFYTMLYTCKLSEEHFKKISIPEGYDSVEIMIHPSVISTDLEHLEDIFDKNVLSPWRAKEFDTLLNKNILKNFKFNAKYPLIIRIYRFLEDFWFKKVDQKLRFLLVGGFNTVFAYGVYAFLLKLIGLPYFFALLIQYIITITVSVLTMRYYVFKSVGNFVEEFYKAWSVYIGLFICNFTGLAFLIQICKIDALWAQGIYLIVSTVATYFLHKYFSFSKKIKEK